MIQKLLPGLILGDDPQSVHESYDTTWSRQCAERAEHTTRANLSLATEGRYRETVSGILTLTLIVILHNLNPIGNYNAFSS